MPRPKKVKESGDELPSKVTVTLEVTEGMCGNCKKVDEKSTGKKTSKINALKGKKVLKNEETKNIVKLVKDLQNTFIVEAGKKAATKQKRVCCCEDISSDSGSSCSCTDCEDSSFTSTENCSSSGCSCQSTSESSSDNEKSLKKQKPTPKLRKLKNVADGFTSKEQIRKK